MMQVIRAFVIDLIMQTRQYELRFRPPVAPFLLSRKSFLSRLNLLRKAVQEPGIVNFLSSACHYQMLQAHVQADSSRQCWLPPLLESLGRGEPLPRWSTGYSQSSLVYDRKCTFEPDV